MHRGSRENDRADILHGGANLGLLPAVSESQRSYAGVAAKDAHAHRHRRPPQSRSSGNCRARCSASCICPIAPGRDPGSNRRAVLSGLASGRQGCGPCARAGPGGPGRGSCDAHLRPCTRQARRRSCAVRRSRSGSATTTASTIIPATPASAAATRPFRAMAAPMSTAAAATPSAPSGLSPTPGARRTSTSRCMHRASAC